MKLLHDNILVTELQDDLEYNGTLIMYDSDSPYMFCRIVEMSDEANSLFNKDSILIIKRYAKEEYISGYYFISLKDVRGFMSEEEYKSVYHID